MSVVAIFIHPPTKGGPMVPLEEVHAVAGRGLEGDRAAKANEPDRELTLIEIEAIEALGRDDRIEFEAGESRRNLVTRGVALNHLVGREFRVGEVTVRGLRLCEPCSHLEKLTRPGVMRGLAHRGGLRAQVLQGGLIRVGDPVHAHSPTIGD